MGRGPHNGYLTASAEIDALRAEVARLKRQRDLAIAHDRQPYPTAEAYEKACAALQKQRARAEAAEAEVARLKREHPETVAVSVRNKALEAEADRLKAAVERAITQRDREQDRAEAAEAKYNELLLSVETKHENESRHETALRYIQEAERRGGEGAKRAAPDVDGGVKT